jgi:hypothetical protein
MPGGWAMLLAAICVWITGLPPASASASEMIERVMAVVAGDVITLGDVTAARELGLVPLETRADPVRDVLTQLIDRSLILAEVERYVPPEPSAQAIDEAVQSVRSRFASGEAFEAVLTRVGIDDKDLRETIRQDLRIRAYIEQRFTVPPPSDDELAGYYRDHPQAFTRAGQTPPFDDVRLSVAQRWADERREALVTSWVAGLRRRAEITDLYVAGR